MTKQLIKVGSVLALSVLMAACSGKKVQENIMIGDANDPNGGFGAGGIVDDSLTGGDLGALTGPQGSFDGDPLGKRVIYFETNSSSLTAEGESIVGAHGKYLADNQNISLILEGNADERGSSEYNLALAEDRAKSVAQLMGAYGVTGSRFEIVSYGEEKPVALGHDEASYSLNRRVEIVYR